MPRVRLRHGQTASAMRGRIDEAAINNLPHMLGWSAALPRHALGSVRAGNFAHYKKSRARTTALTHRPPYSPARALQRGVVYASLRCHTQSTHKACRCQAGLAVAPCGDAALPLCRARRSPSLSGPITAESAGCAPRVAVGDGRFTPAPCQALSMLCMGSRPGLT